MSAKIRKYTSNHEDWPMDNLVARSITGAGQDKGLKIGNVIYTYFFFISNSFSVTCYFGIKQQKFLLQ